MWHRFKLRIRRWLWRRRFNRWVRMERPHGIIAMAIDWEPHERDKQTICLVKPTRGEIVGTVKIVNKDGTALIETAHKGE